MNLKNKVVLITGSSTGIGAATAVAFAKKGAKVVVTYNKSKKEGEKVLEACKKYEDCILLKLDVSDDESIKNVYKQVFKKFEKLDILINNAGIATEPEFHDFKFSDVQKEIDINLSGLIKMTLECLPIMKKMKEAIIMNVSSKTGKQPNPRYPVYTATKFGVRGFTQALASYLPINIKTYCINPAATATQMMDFEGVNPKVVADIIIKTAEDSLSKKSGDDIDCKDYY